MYDAVQWYTVLVLYYISMLLHFTCSNSVYNHCILLYVVHHGVSELAASRLEFDTRKPLKLNRSFHSQSDQLTKVPRNQKIRMKSSDKCVCIIQPRSLNQHVILSLDVNRSRCEFIARQSRHVSLGVSHFLNDKKYSKS
jgi:hypothetical protein